MYVIEQFARHISRWVDVTLLVEKGDRVPIQDVAVRATLRSSPEGFLDADTLVIPADTSRGDLYAGLPPSKGRPHLLFQGYGAPDAEVVRHNLLRGFRVLAMSGWLVDEAQRFGAVVRQVPYGLERELFHRDSGVARDAQTVAMMTHGLDQKGTADGLAALSAVRAALPRTQVILFGEVEPEFPAQFIHQPSRAQVAEIMRRCAVFVCASWEEGFGMPGLEALACGAALATTDTKGCRDYAVEGVTALVSPPRAPEHLAVNIVKLLSDEALRNRLIERGAALVEEQYRSWNEAAQGFLSACRGDW